VKMFIVDSFTDKIYKGNPAAVCLIEKKLNELEYQNIAMEMNLSETAFLLKKSENVYDLRWFTPEEEVNLCGHATLASAHILWEQGIAAKNLPISFNTLSGVLSAKYEQDWITLDFPAQNPVESKGDPDLLEAIPGDKISILEDELSYIIIMKNEEDIREMNPDFDLLYKTRKKEVIVTALSENPEYDFVSRFFGPAIGIKEDPVTGSAHCYLAPYWSGILGRKDLTGYQASRRGGFVHCTVVGDRVLLKGKACTFLSGDIVQ